MCVRIAGFSCTFVSCVTVPAPKRWFRHRGWGQLRGRSVPERFWTDLFRLFRFYLLDESGRIAVHHCHGRDVVRDHAVGAHNGAVADAYARQDGGVDAVSDFVFDNDGRIAGGAAVLGCRVAVCGSADGIFCRTDRIYGSADRNYGTADCEKRFFPMDCRQRF